MKVRDIYIYDIEIEEIAAGEVHGGSGVAARRRKKDCNLFRFSSLSSYTVLAGILGFPSQLQIEMASTNINSLTKWSDLPKELLDLILAKMSPISIYNSKGVCSSWRSTVKAYISSRIYSTHYKVPWLMLFPEQEKDKFSFYSLDEKRVYKRMGRPRDFDIFLCIGSNHGWLVMLDEKADPYLFNPFTLARIQLPPFETYPDVVRLSKSDDNNFHVELPDYSHLGDKVLKFKSVKELRRRLILNAVLSSNPSHDDFFVLMILDLNGWDGCQVAFYHSRGTKWMRIEDRLERSWYQNYYTDFICYNDKFTALNNTSVEFWDIVDSSPIKRAEIIASLPRSDLMATPIYIGEYLAELFGDLFLVAKSIEANYNHTNIYKTSLFQIYKLDFTMNKWEEVDSLGDYALLLGGNQSKLISRWDIPEFEADSIYFTDDIWAFTTDDIWEKWHGCDQDYDFGEFNMEDKSIKLYYQCKRKNIPPPFWIDPNSLLDA